MLEPGACTACSDRNLNLPHVTDFAVAKAEAFRCRNLTLSGDTEDVSKGTLLQGTTVTTTL